MLVLLLAIWPIVVIIWIIVLGRIMDDINKELPEEQRFELMKMWWTPGDSARFFRAVDGWVRRRTSSNSPK